MSDLSMVDVLKRLKYKSDPKKFDVKKAYNDCPDNIKKILKAYDLPDDEIVGRDRLRQLWTNLSAHGYEVEWNDIGYITYLGKTVK